MIFQYLRTFLGLIDERGFTAAARRLGMTQPGVSQHLKMLEDYYAVQLVVRGRKKVELTAAGERLQTYARQLFREMTEFRAKIGQDNPHEGLCRFASPGSFGMKMYSFLLKLQQQYPGLVIHYDYRPNLTILDEILTDRLDVGHVSMAPRYPEIASQIIDSERLCLVVPASFQDVSFAGLKKLGFINHPDGFHHASRLLLTNFPKEFRSMNQLPIRGFINQITRIPEPVALKMGFTALPEYAARAFPDQKKLKILPLKKHIIDPIYRVWKRGRELPSRFAFIQEQFESIKQG